eukprot:364248-Chlamydomonas_euryale.AAC.2
MILAHAAALARTRRCGVARRKDQDSGCNTWLTIDAACTCLRLCFFPCAPLPPSPIPTFPTNALPCPPPPPLSRSRHKNVKMAHPERSPPVAVLIATLAWRTSNAPSSSAPCPCAAAGTL